ncbi:MAG: pyridoxal-phosphate dependent enzyme [bacterium]|nr:pyridoxal-phosphate dependent enzyme [bacterium]
MHHIDNPYAPIEEIHQPQFQQKKVKLFLKREDLSHPYISGNKWRKLKYHLLAAKAQNKEILVTFGGAYSNHLLATAAAGAKYGFKTHGFVRGHEVSNPVLHLCKLFGMQLQFVSRENYRQKESLFSNYFGLNQSAVNIPEGGAGPLGEQGVAEIFEEKQMKENFEHIFCSVGTGGTLRGLIKGLHANHIEAHLHGVVVLKGAEEMDQEFLDLSSNNYTLHHRFHVGGYAKTNEVLLAYIQNFASTTGVLLDQVYEGKMMLGIQTLVAENYFKPGSKILALHNGGLVGLLGMIR